MRSLACRTNEWANSSRAESIRSQIREIRSQPRASVQANRVFCMPYEGDAAFPEVRPHFPKWVGIVPTSFVPNARPMDA